MRPGMTLVSFDEWETPKAASRAPQAFCVRSPGSPRRERRRRRVLRCNSNHTHILNPMTEALSDIRDRIHRKSQEYFTLAYARRDKSRWRMFYGATDALLDASMAARAFGKAIRSDPPINLLICYGFLQAIYIQQDAVSILSEAVGIKWNPNDNLTLREIRDTRNRLTGHPAFAGESRNDCHLRSFHITKFVRSPSKVASILKIDWKR